MWHPLAIDTHTPPSPTQSHAVWRKCPAPGFSLGRVREDWTIYSMFWLFRWGCPREWGLTWRTDETWHTLGSWGPLRTKKELSDMLLLHRTHRTADRYQREQEITSSWKKKNKKKPGKVPQLKIYTHRSRKYMSRKKVWEAPESLARLIGEGLSQFLKTWRLGSFFKCTDNNTKFNEHTHIHTNQGKMAQRNKNLQKLILKRKCYMNLLTKNSK